MAETLQLDLPILLPDVPDAHDACVDRLVGTLKEHAGVARVHVVEATGDEPARLCIHYDPNVLSLPRIRQQAERLGARLTERFGHVVWKADGLSHQRRARTVAEHLRRRAGVVEAEAVAGGPVRIEFDREATDERALQEALRKLGVRVVDKKTRAAKATRPGAHAHEEHAHA